MANTTRPSKTQVTTPKDRAVRGSAMSVNKKANQNKENQGPAEDDDQHNRESRRRRPSTKVAEQIEAEKEKARLEAGKEMRREERLKKQQRKQNKAAGQELQSDDDLEELHDAAITSRIVLSKPAAVAALVQRSSRVPPTPTPTTLQPARFNDDDNIDAPRGRTSHRGSWQGRQIHSPSQDQLDPHSPSRSRSRSCSRPRSPSPGAGSRRGRSPTADLEAEIDHSAAKAQKINDDGDRPKAAQYESSAREVILEAASIYRILIFTEDAFPEPSKQIEFIKRAWSIANENSGLPPFALDPNIAKIIKARGPQARGEAKAKTADLVEVLFGFETGRNKDTVARNRKKFENLKHQNGFVFQEDLTDVGGARKGIYQHPIIQRSINKMWFKNRRDEGIEYEESFDPLPVPAIALMLTAIEANIDEWATGIQTDISFYADDYRSVYLEHINTLLAFGEATQKHDLLGRLQRKVYNYGRLHAGAPAAALKNVPTVPTSAFADAIREYEENSETDDEGDMMYA